jgi:hypothetical protein
MKKPPCEICRNGSRTGDKSGKVQRDSAAGQPSEQSTGSAGREGDRVYGAVKNSLIETVPQ